ncbi:MAG: GNAT family N-acetyltransferase [Granulosicoccus sp.]
MAKVPVLESKRLRLRAHEVSDYPHVAAMWADPEVVKYISGVPSTPTESWSRLLRYAGMWELIGYGYWAVESRDDGRFLGEVGFADFKRGLGSLLDDVPEAGWVIKSSESGCGYASEAINAMLGWADEVAGLPATACILTPDHDASLRVAHKAGYCEHTRLTFGSDPVLLMRRDIQTPR